MRCRALVGFALVATLGATAGLARTATSPSVATVPCAEIVGEAHGPREGGNRLVLGVVSAPPRYLPQVVRTAATPFPYWRKAGMVIRANPKPVTVSVPEAWRNRVVIAWGNNGERGSVLRFDACPAPAGRWNAYAGGFEVRSPSACVPLIFQVGKRRTTLRFGVGRRC